MQVSFTLTADEVARGAIRSMRRSGMVKRLRLATASSLILSTTLLCLGVFLLAMKRQPGTPLSFGTGVGAGMGLFSLFLTIMHIMKVGGGSADRRATAAVRQSVERGEMGNATGPRIITIEENAIVCSDPDGESAIFWSTLRDVRLESDLLLIFVSASSAWTIPRRAFSSPHEESAFIAEIERRRTPAHVSSNS